ncbi:hypothetical protein NL676_030944 [Syzygium grande]|nr:hypothetical protein NL676_030944 [Syzygium grande]
MAAMRAGRAAAPAELSPYRSVHLVTPTSVVFDKRSRFWGGSRPIRETSASREPVPEANFLWQKPVRERSLPPHRPTVHLRSTAFPKSTCQLSFPPILHLGRGESQSPTPRRGDPACERTDHTCDSKQKRKGDHFSPFSERRHAQEVESQ